VNPNPTSLLPRALALHQEGKLEAAATLYAQVRQRQPRAFDAWHLGGLAALQLGRMKEAEALLRRALVLGPTSALCAMRLGVALFRLGRLPEAIAALESATRLDPKLPESWEHLSAARGASGKGEEAIAASERAQALRPDDPGSALRTAALIAEFRGFRAAVPALEAAVARWPNHAECREAAGVALANLHFADAALVHLDHALALDPSRVHARLGRALALQEAFRLKEAIAAYDDVLVRSPRNPDALSARLMCLHYLDSHSPAELFDAHRAAGAALEDVSAPPFPCPPVRTRLRVAFVSRDFRRHAVAAFIEPFLARAPRDRVEVLLVHDSPIRDATTDRLRGLAERWIETAGLSQAAFAAAVLAEAPDIAVDLAGHTGLNRLPAFARRLAPVQVTYLGYPNTTGVREMDFRLTDGTADPEGVTDPYHTERLERFAPCAWCYCPDPEAPEVAAPPSVRSPDAGITFGSFNNPAKISDTTVRLWAGALAAVPDARILLKGHGLNAPERQAELRARFRDLGVDDARVRFFERTPDSASHLRLYAEIDIALDTFPYHGTTTTCEALWMGRPVLTLAGKDHRSRVGVSLLSAVGLRDWIAADTADFAARAASLASDREGLAHLSRTLRDRLRASPIFDYEGQAARFWATLLELPGKVVERRPS
jgi:protein O-GlcNAc transferase